MGVEVDKHKISRVIAEILSDVLHYRGDVSAHTSQLVFDLLADSLKEMDEGMLQEILVDITKEEDK